MRVVLKGADGSTTAIGTIDTRSGEAALDGPWYTLSGQRLQGKPAMRVVVLKHQPLLQTGSPGGDMYYIHRHDDDMNHMA